MQIGARNLQADYDEASDTLYLYSKKEKASNSVSLGNINIDYSKNGVAGLEFLNASETILPLLLACPKSLLEDAHHLKTESLARIRKAGVSLRTAASLVVIAFTLEFDEKPLPLEGRLVMPLPSPSEAILAKALAATA